MLHKIAQTFINDVKTIPEIHSKWPKKTEFSNKLLYPGTLPAENNNSFLRPHLQLKGVEQELCRPVIEIQFWLQFQAQRSKGPVTVPVSLLP